MGKNRPGETGLKQRKSLDFFRGLVYDKETPNFRSAMDIIKALRELHAERKRLDSVIASLEAQLAAARKKAEVKKSPARRGRKSMSAAERLVVSKRMTLYWEARRAQLQAPESPVSQSNSTSAP